MESLNSQFTSAISQSDLAVPIGVVDYQGDVSKKRFDVYRNNVIVSLLEALRQTYPAIEMLVGKDFFQALALTFIEKYKPTSPIMYLYGKEFSQYIHGFEPLDKYPYMADVALLEYNRVQSYHAEDAPVIAGENIAEFGTENFGDLRFEKHSAVYIERSVWPIVSILVANLGGGDMRDVNLEGMEDALIVRPECQVDVHSLQAGQVVFYQALFSGLTLNEAYYKTVNVVMDFDLEYSITMALTHGLFQKVYL
jgi:hypothetical protein